MRAPRIAGLVVGSRIFNKGDMANVEKFGTVTAIPEEGYVDVKYEDGTEARFMPDTNFMAPHARCRVVA